MDPAEKQELIFASDKLMKDVAEGRSYGFNKAYVKEVKVSRYHKPIVCSEETTITMSKAKLAFYMLIPVYFIAAAGAFAYYADAIFPIIFFVPIALVGGYYIAGMYKHSIQLNGTGMTVNENYISWEVVLKCYIMEHYEGKTRLWSLFVIYNDGSSNEFDIAGLDHYFISHAISSYMEAYTKNTITSPPS